MESGQSRADSPVGVSPSAGRVARQPWPRLHADLLMPAS